MTGPRFRSPQFAVMMGTVVRPAGVIRDTERVPMGLRFTYRRATFAAAAALVCVPLLGTIGAADAGAATTTTTLAPKPPTTTTTTTGPTGAATTTPGVPSTAGPTTTTTTAPQHVANQPNLNALSPHVLALRGSGVQYQSSSGGATQGNGPNVPSFLSSPGGPYLYDANGRIVILHGVNVVYKHAPYIAHPDPGEPWNFSVKDAQKMRSLGFNVVRLGIEWQALAPG